MNYYAIKVKGGTVLTEDFKAQMREAIRMVLAGEKLNSPEDAVKHVRPVLDASVKIVSSELSHLFDTAVFEAIADGPEKLRAETFEKLGVTP